MCRGGALGVRLARFEVGQRDGMYIKVALRQQLECTHPTRTETPVLLVSRVEARRRVGNNRRRGSERFLRRDAPLPATDHQARLSRSPSKCRLASGVRAASAECRVRGNGQSSSEGWSCLVGWAVDAVKHVREARPSRRASSIGSRSQVRLPMALPTSLFRSQDFNIQGIHRFAPIQSYS